MCARHRSLLKSKGPSSKFQRYAKNRQLIFTKIYRKHVADLLYHGQQYLNGRVDLKRDGHLLKTMHALVDRHVPETKFMWILSVVINEDPRQTCDLIAYMLGISHASVHKILTEDLGKRKVATKFVPHDLTIEEKLNRVHIATSLLLRFFHESMEFLNWIVAIDETWVYCYEHELKRQSSE